MAKINPVSPLVKRTLCSVGGLAQVAGTSDAADANSAVTMSAGDVTAAVTTSFAFGWQMARLYTGQLGSAAVPQLADDLPGLSSLPPGELVDLGLAQADVALGRLKKFLGGADLPTTAAVRAQIKETPGNRDAIRKAILDLHVQLLVQLTAADYRLGKAYGLGRALADTCASAHGNPAQRQQALSDHLQPGRMAVLAGWLDDLKTVMPAHASQGVADSLLGWEGWAGATDLAKADAAFINDSTYVLHRCGQRWRAILSAEKAATDMLEIGDYVIAARGTLGRASAIARSLVLRLWMPLTLALALIGIGIWLIVANHSTAQVIAGLGTIAGGLSITWRSAAGSLEHLSLSLVRPLWEAQLDAVVAGRLTPAPQSDYLPGTQPPRGRMRRAWHALRTPDPPPVRSAPAALVPPRTATGTSQAPDP